MLRRFVLVVLLLLAFAGTSRAGEFVRGDNGYYFRPGSTVAYEDAGYWYKDWYFVRGCYGQCGYWAYQWLWYADYRQVKLVPGTPGLKERVLRMAADRDQTILEYQTTVGLIEKLGLNVNVENYGNGLFPAYSQQRMYQAQVSSYATRVDAYGQDPNYDIVNQQIGRNTERSMELAAQIAAPLAEWRGTYERVAIARSKDATAVQLAQALTPKSTTIETRSSTVGPARLQLRQPVRAAVRLAAASSCIECHAGQGQAVKSFDIASYDPATADDELVMRVRKYIRPAKDPNTNHCPPGKQLDAQAMSDLLVGGEPKEPRKEIDPP